MYLCLPFNFFSMYWYGIMMAGMKQSFSTTPHKTKKRETE